VPGRQSHEKAVRRSAQAAFFVHLTNGPLARRETGRLFLWPVVQKRPPEAALLIRFRMTVQHFLFEQPENVQYFVIGAAQAEGGSEMALKEIKRAFGDK
jgi:hypothetical protein